MNPVFLVVVHWLHIVSGVVWGGGLALFSLVVWPALLKQPAPEARALYLAMEKSAAPVLGAAGGLAMLLGILRGTWLGPVQSFGALFGTRYGWLMIVAFLTIFLLMGYGGSVRRRLDSQVWNGSNWQPGAARFVWRSNIVMLAGLGVILTCMVMLRLGV